jgi:hypothetical protein
MRILGRGAGLLILSCCLAGCQEAIPEGVATPDNPQVGIDKAKQLSGTFDEMNKAAAKEGKAARK